MKFLEQFIQDNQRLIKELKNCNHASDISPNPYHMEGDVWIHTMMVYKELDSNSSQELKLAALLHDIGKIEARYVKQNGFVSFREHENISTIKAIPILKKYYDISNKNEYKKIINILHMINWHGKLWNKKLNENEYIEYLNYSFGNDIELFNDLVNICKADAFGRILKETQEEDKVKKTFQFLENFILYNPFQYPTHKPSQEVIFMIGLSGSGKSTYIQNNKELADYTIIGVDKVLDSQSTLDYNSSYSKSNVKKAHDEVILKIKKSVEKKENIIIDMTNLTAEQRRQKLKLFPTTIYKHNAVVFLKELKEIENNIKARKGKSIKFEFLQKQISRFELPTNNEFTDIRYIL